MTKRDPLPADAAAEIIVDEALLRRLLTAQFPEWAAFPLDTVPSAGAVNALYQLGTDMVVRLPIVARYADDLLKEYDWLPKFAAQLPFAIPEPLAQGRPGDGYPFSWCVYRWIEGQTWGADRLRAGNEAARDLAAFIIAMRQIDTSGAPPPRAPATLAAADGYVREAIAAAADEIDAATATAAWDAALALPPYAGPLAWIHGDLSRPGNLLVNEGRLTAVIDFGSASPHDPARELMVAWSLFSGQSRAAFRAALDVDDATWARAKAWTLIRAHNVAHYRHTNPELAAECRHTIAEVLADFANQ